MKNNNWNNYIININDEEGKDELDWLEISSEMFFLLFLNLSDF